MTFFSKKNISRHENLLGFLGFFCHLDKGIMARKLEEKLFFSKRGRKALQS